MLLYDYRIGLATAVVLKEYFDVIFLKPTGQPLQRDERKISGNPPGVPDPTLGADNDNYEVTKRRGGRGGWGDLLTQGGISCVSAVR